MSRYFIEIAYDGTNYHGWQIQKNANSVQAEINKAISTLLQSEIMITGAGRTDAGVHAKQMFAHFDFSGKIPQNFLFKLNCFLANDIVCKSIIKVNDDLHARFDATSRTYEYWIIQQKDPFLKNKAFFFHYHLDINEMNKAAKTLFNFEDFTSFSKSKTDTKTNNCKILVAQWQQIGNELIFTITANRFLRNMVRAIVGTLLDVGQGKLTTEEFKKIIASKDRSEAGKSVPAHGLYLSKVVYSKVKF